MSKASLGTKLEYEGLLYLSHELSLDLLGQLSRDLSDLYQDLVQSLKS